MSYEYKREAHWEQTHSEVTEAGFGLDYQTPRNRARALFFGFIYLHPPVDLSYHYYDSTIRIHVDK